MISVKKPISDLIPNNEWKYIIGADYTPSRVQKMMGNLGSNVGEWEKKTTPALDLIDSINPSKKLRSISPTQKGARLRKCGKSQKSIFQSKKAIRTQAKSKHLDSLTKDNSLLHEHIYDDYYDANDSIEKAHKCDDHLHVEEHRCDANDEFLPGKSSCQKEEEIKPKSLDFPTNDHHSEDNFVNNNITQSARHSKRRNKITKLQIARNNSQEVHQFQGSLDDWNDSSQEIDDGMVQSDVITVSDLPSHSDDQSETGEGVLYEDNDVLQDANSKAHFHIAISRNNSTKVEGESSIKMRANSTQCPSRDGESKQVRDDSQEDTKFSAISVATCETSQSFGRMIDSKENCAHQPRNEITPYSKTNFLKGTGKYSQLQTKHRSKPRIQIPQESAPVFPSLQLFQSVSSLPSVQSKTFSLSHESIDSLYKEKQTIRKKTKKMNDNGCGDFKISNSLLPRIPPKKMPQINKSISNSHPHNRGNRSPSKNRKHIAQKCHNDISHLTTTDEYYDKIISLYGNIMENIKPNIFNSTLDAIPAIENIQRKKLQIKSQNYLNFKGVSAKSFTPYRNYTNYRLAMEHTVEMGVLKEKL